MNEEEIVRKNLKKLANNIFSKLNDVEKSYLLMVNNEKNKQINELQQELQRKDDNWNELKNTLETCIYGIVPKGCSINYNCEYDSEEDYIRAMQEQSRLNTYKFVLDKIKELEKM